MGNSKEGKEKRRKERSGEERNCNRGIFSPSRLPLQESKFVVGTRKIERLSRYYPRELMRHGFGF
jgi:hypothetical protein